MIEEIWKPIVNYENLYEVSNYGKVKRLMNRYGNISNKILKSIKNKRGYSYINLCKNGKTKFFNIHRLVLETFVGPCPHGMECCHNDGDPSNNFIGNLRWDTHKNNIQDSIEQGTFTKGSKQGLSKLVEIDIPIIRQLHLEGKSNTEIAKIYNVSPKAIWQIINDKTWRKQ